MPKVRVKNVQKSGNKYVGTGYMVEGKQVTPTIVDFTSMTPVKPGEIKMVSVSRTSDVKPFKTHKLVKRPNK